MREVGGVGGIGGENQRQVANVCDRGGLREGSRTDVGIREGLRRAGNVELDDAIVVPVGDDQISRWLASDAERSAERGWREARSRDDGRDTRGGDSNDAIVSGVGDVEVAHTVDAETLRVVDSRGDG